MACGAGEETVDLAYTTTPVLRPPQKSDYVFHVRTLLTLTQNPCAAKSEVRQPLHQDHFIELHRWSFYRGFAVYRHRRRRKVKHIYREHGWTGETCPLCIGNIYT